MADEVLDEEEFLERVTEGEREAAVAVLKGGATIARAVQAARGAVEFAEGITRIQAESSPPERPLACGEGCAWCCHFPVAVSAAEVIRIAEHVRSKRTPAERAALHQRVVEADQSRRSGSGAATRTPCPLLDGNRCSVYDVRPLSCRGCNSYDASSCERYYWSGRGTMPVYSAQYEIHTSVFAGLLRGLRDQRLEHQPLELVAALRLVLEDPEAPRRWLKGQPVWEGAAFADVLPEIAEDVTGGRPQGKPTS